MKEAKCKIGYCAKCLRAVMWRATKRGAWIKCDLEAGTAVNHKCKQNEDAK